MGDNPKTQKDTKKVAKDPIHHSSDSDDSTGDIECSTCGISFSDGKAYENHMQGKKHQKKVLEAKLKAKNLAADTKKSDEEEDEDDDSNDMYCEVCEKYFSGYISYVTHMKSSVHAKNVKKQKLKEKLRNMPEVLDNNGKSDDDDSEDDGILTKPYARCNVCKKEFSGPENYDLHMKSAAHKKKVKQTQAVENLKAKHEDETQNSDGEEFFSKCDICQKSFSGVVPYKNHMESKVHKRNVEKKKVAEEVKEFYDEDSGYVCKECKKSFSDPVAFKCHLKNNSHEKQKAKAALREFLNAHPEIVFVYPLLDEDSENDADDEDSNYYLICKLCNVSFSGPESAQDHVKSKKHLNAKRDKKQKQLLKELKNSDVKTNDGKLKDSKDDKLSVKGTPNDDTSKIPENSHADDFELI